ncbi:MFS transporter [Leucobacter sp. M11]|uniref:MFS transporter n=1 Tax=Leucobacter sp. M11 TaxID=2993565 RepID=UPI002D7F2E7E|nr:MFS transporter [Leucobacter sp. M11]MEB4613900.1 MFS transporter [Leucobacter sp. M11]
MSIPPTPTRPGGRPSADAVGAPSPETAAPLSTDMRRSLLASTSGNILEWFEWSAYAVFSPFIAVAMFDPANPASSLLSTFAVLAVSFLMRPLGGMLFGWVADRKGRKFVLLTTMIMMSVGSLIIGIMPTYEQVGIWAAVILLFARVLQGFAHGGESATSTTYVAEIAPKERRGLWSSLIHVAIVGGSMLAFLCGALITGILGDEGTQAWGWRIPFLIGALAALIVLWMRRHMEESEVFAEEKTPEQAAAEAAQLAVVWPRKRMVLSVIRMILFTSGITVVHYTWTSYMHTHAIKTYGMESSTAYWVTFGTELIVLVALPFFGRLSDRFGRKPLMIVFASFMFALAFPLAAMVGADWWQLFIPQLIALLFWAIAGSMFAAMQAENFPTAMRTRGIGFAYSMAVALFGGTAPYLNQLLQNVGLEWVFSAYVMVLCAFTLISTLTMRETSGIDLRELDQPLPR